MAPNTDTIAAIATPPGQGGIGVVRVSGEGATSIARQLLGRLPKPRRAELHDFRGTDGALIDKGLVLFFPRPPHSPASTCWNCTAMAARW